MTTTMQLEVAILNIYDVSDMTGLSLDTLKSLQLSDAGPAYIEDAGCIRYTVEAVCEFQTKRSAAHKRLMASYSGKPVLQSPAPIVATVPALVGFGKPVSPARFARIGNGLYCRVGTRARV